MKKHIFLEVLDETSFSGRHNEGRDPIVELLEEVHQSWHLGFDSDFLSNNQILLNVSAKTTNNDILNRDTVIEYVFNYDISN